MGNESAEANRLDIFLLNSNGCPTRLYELRARLDNRSIWIFNDVRRQKAEELYFEGYNTILSNDEKNCRYAGGCAIIAPKRWTMTRVDTLDNEALVVDLNDENGHGITIGTTYNKPGETRFINLFERINESKQNNKLIVIAADFNAPVRALGGRYDSPAGNKLIEAAAKSNFNWVENFTPTYVSASNAEESNVLDHYFISENLREKINSISVEEAVGSDHMPLRLSIEMAQPVINHKYVDMDHLANTLHFHTDWSVGKYYSASEIDSAVAAFTGKLQFALQNSTREIRSKRLAEFSIGDDTKAAIKRKRIVDRRRRAATSETNKIALQKEFQSCCKLVRKLLDRDRKIHLSKEASSIAMEKDQGLKWKKIRKLTSIGRKSNTAISNLTREDGSTTRTARDIVEEHANRLEQTHQPITTPEMDEEWIKKVNEEAEETLTWNIEGEIEETNEQELHNIIAGLKKKSAPGLDGITHEMLKCIPTKGLKELSEIFNACMRLGYMPLTWKKAEITMLPKPGRDIRYSKNYRPVSLLPTIGKVLERVVKVRLDRITTSKNILPRYASGFRKGRGTTENIVRLVEDGYRAFQSDGVCCAAFLDIDRAFDALWMQGVVKKMKDLGYPRYLVRFVSHYLTDRFLRVKQGDTKSRWIKMCAGTPQGAIISPDLFLIFTADMPLPDKKNEASSLYADDSATWVVSIDLIAAQTALQGTLDKLGVWSTKWRLMPAPQKSNILIITRKTSINSIDGLFRVSLLGSTIPVVKEAKFLGTILDRRLSWKSQFEEMIKKGLQKVFLIRKLSRHLNEPSNLPMQLFDSLITSIFTYNAIQTISASNAVWKTVQKFEERAYRIIFGIAAGTSGGRIVDELVGTRIQEKMRFHALKRLKTMTNTNALIQDLIFDKRGSTNKYVSPIHEILAMTGINVMNDCIMCKSGIRHECVRNCHQRPA